MLIVLLILLIVVLLLVRLLTALLLVLLVLTLALLFFLLFLLLSATLFFLVLLVLLVLFLLLSTQVLAHRQTDVVAEVVYLCSNRLRQLLRRRCLLSGEGRRWRRRLAASGCSGSGGMTAVVIDEALLVPQIARRVLPAATGALAGKLEPKDGKKSALRKRKRGRECDGPASTAFVAKLGSTIASHVPATYATP